MAQNNGVELMLRALLMGHEPQLISWVSGYVYGETDNGDTYITLYHPAPGMKDKICKVYQQDWDKLPDFVERPSENTKALMKTSRRKPTWGKDEAIEAGIYQECFLFEVVMHMGRRPTDNAEREKRFLGVLNLTHRYRQGYEPAAEAEKKPVAPNQAKNGKPTTAVTSQPPAEPGQFIINSQETAWAFIASETKLTYEDSKKLYEKWKKEEKPTSPTAMWDIVRKKTLIYRLEDEDSVF